MPQYIAYTIHNARGVKGKDRDVATKDLQIIRAIKEYLPPKVELPHHIPELNITIRTIEE